MKTLLSFLSLMFSANFVCNAQNLPEVPEGFKWEKVESLSDEFDYWDATKWAISSASFPRSASTGRQC